MQYDEMDILTRGQKAVEGFYLIPYEQVDKRLREATKHTGEVYKAWLKQQLAEAESYVEALKRLLAEEEKYDAA